MQYNPQYCTIVVRNTDGSGYLRQFKTLAEAKDAYASISASGAAVYLYQPPTKSLASFEAGANVPDYNNGITYGTGDQVKFQGKVYQLNNFIGAAGYTPASHPNQWTEITSFTPPSVPPISSTGSPVVENGVTRNPFTFNQNDNVVTQTMSKVGCVIGSIVDADGQQAFGSVYPRYIFQENGVTVDEKLGDINTNGCYYPNGFRIEFNGQQDIYFSVQTLNSLDYSGSVYGPYYEVSSLLGWSRDYVVANGDGTTSIEATVGIPWNRQQNFNIIEWEFYQNGDTPYSASGNIDFSNWVKIGQPIPNGSYLVTYKVPPDDNIHSGYWIASIINADSSPKVKWVFEPVEPDQPPPPPCSITKKVRNPVSGVVDDECDPDVIYPFTVEENCEPPLTVELEGQTVTLGTNKKTGMDNGYGDVVWGPCSGMVYVANGTLVLSGTDLNYFSDGEGSYYTEDKNPNPCDSSGTVISNEQEDITVNINGSTYTVGFSYERTVADGNCGSSLEVGSEYLPNGTLITEDSDNKYYSNGIGGYYAEPITPEITGYEGEEEYITVAGSSVVSRTRTRPQYSNNTVGEWSEWNYTPNGTFYTSDESYNYYANGSGGYYSEPKQQQCDPSGTYISGTTSTAPVYISELSANYDAGTSYENTYADGICGTYNESGTNWNPYGTYIINGSGYNFYSDGMGGYYAESDGSSPSCDSYGTYYSGNSYDATVYINELGSSYTAGSSYESTYADGNCGSYTEYGTSWYEYGYLIATDGSNNYFSDGNGSYYSQSTT